MLGQQGEQGGLSQGLQQCQVGLQRVRRVRQLGVMVGWLSG